jgi:hypothetical protein
LGLKLPCRRELCWLGWSDHRQEDLDDGSDSKCGGAGNFIHVHFAISGRHFRASGGRGGRLSGKVHALVEGNAGASLTASARRLAGSESVELLLTSLRPELNAGAAGPAER